MILDPLVLLLPARARRSRSRDGRRRKRPSLPVLRTVTMKEVRDSLFGSRVTSGLGAVVAIFSLLGLQGNPETTEAIHQFLTYNADTIAQIIAVVALLFARDPEVLVKPKNNQEAIDDRAVERLLERFERMNEAKAALVKEENANFRQREEETKIKMMDVSPEEKARYIL